MNIIQKYKLYRNVRDSINSVAHMRSISSEQYSIVEDDKNITCTHHYPCYYFEGNGNIYMNISNFDNNKTEQIQGRFARIMFNLLEKKNRNQVKSK